MRRDPGREQVAFAVLGAVSKALHASLRASPSPVVALAALGAEPLPADLEGIPVTCNGFTLARVCVVPLARAVVEAAKRSPLVARLVGTKPAPSRRGAARAWALFIYENGGCDAEAVVPRANPPPHPLPLPSKPSQANQ